MQKCFTIRKNKVASVCPGCQHGFISMAQQQRQRPLARGRALCPPKRRPLFLTACPIRYSVARRQVLFQILCGSAIEQLVPLLRKGWRPCCVDFLCRHFASNSKLPRLTCSTWWWCQDHFSLVLRLVRTNLLLCFEILIFCYQLFSQQHVP